MKSKEISPVVAVIAIVVVLGLIYVAYSMLGGRRAGGVSGPPPSSGVTSGPGGVMVPNTAPQPPNQPMQQDPAAPQGTPAPGMPPPS